MHQCHRYDFTSEESGLEESMGVTGNKVTISVFHEAADFSRRDHSEHNLIQSPLQVFI